MIRPVNSAQSSFLRFTTGAAVNKGQICVLDGDTAVPAAEGVNTQVILGVAVEDAASGAIVKLYPADQEFEFDVYQGSTVDVPLSTHQGVDYDIYVDGAAGDGSAEGEMYLDLNDTDGAFVRVIKIDAIRRTVTGRFFKSLIYV
jgi:hypothetical protein